MKTTRNTFLHMSFAIAVFFVSFSPAFAQEDIYSGSPVYEDIYSGSPTYQDIYSGSPIYQDIYSGSPVYEDIYSGSPVYEDVYSGSPSYQDVYTTPSYTYTSGYSYTPEYSWTGYVAPTYTDSSFYTNQSYSYPTYTYPTYNYGGGTTTVCADGQAPINGSCTRTTVIPVTNNTVCADGKQRNANNTCTRTTTVPVTNTTICADGLAPVNGSCVRTNTLPVITNTVCSDGLAPFNGSCVRTNTIPTSVQTICSDGSYPINGSCTRTVTYPTVNYQSCWDGTTIPLYSVCPSQYKVCANGTSIPVNQTCYYGNTYVPYTPPTTIKFNNVITSVATEITLTSARCNGIGLIASNAPSTGWFEYGETPNLGRETAKANIGSSPTAPFSNVLANLKPTTKYYCRAVMQNQYGVVKGEVVAFTTKAKAVSYVKPVTKTTVKSTTVTKKKNEIICIDGQVVTVTSKSAADLINAGQKLVSLQIEKSSGNLSRGSQVAYKLTLKNLSDENLSGITVKITIPNEVTLTNASAGNYDPTMHVLTVTNVPMNAYGEAVITWTGKVSQEASVGTSMVTTAYTRYSVPGSQVEDEVTAYVVGTVVTGNDTGTGTGTKKIIGASTAGGFLPNSLVEWLALIAILFIIFILGRSVYSSYTNDKATGH